MLLKRIADDKFQQYSLYGFW